jgi:hypothetical protein
MQQNPERDRPAAGSTDDHEEGHEPPRGALLITVGYLIILTILWMQAYMTLLTNGGIPQQ